MLVLLATGCGGSSKEGATAQKREPQSDLAPRVAHSARFSLALPRSWKTVSSDDLGTPTAQQLRADPYLASLLDELAKPGQLVRLIAADNAVHEDYRANCSVVVDAASGVTVEEMASDEFADGVTREMSRYAELVALLDNELLVLPAGKAAHLVLHYQSPDTGGLLAQHQFRMVASGKDYILVCNAVAEREPTDGRSFMRIASSLRLGQ